MKFVSSGKARSLALIAALAGLLAAAWLFGQTSNHRSTIVAHLSGDAVKSPQAPSYSLFYSFQCGTDGAYPMSGLVRDQAGNLYGTTELGGSTGIGTVFKVTPSGTETVLHSFTGPPDGFEPQVSVTLDPQGNVFGTTQFGGQLGVGVVFVVTAAGKETVFYNFNGSLGGGQPLGTLIRDAQGNFYGTTTEGGPFGPGVVFKLTPTGKETVLYGFGTSPDDGIAPSGGLARDSAGNLYGTTQGGGAKDAGTVFEVSAGGEETLLHSFLGYPIDGALPLEGGLLRDATGSLYGATVYGGPQGDGTVFKVTPAGVERVLLNFSGTSRGGNPYDALAEDKAGILYGTTAYGGSAPCGDEGCGVLFALTPAGKEIVLHNFAGSPSDGEYPFGGVIRDSAGNLYGTLFAGGANGCGAVFKATP